MVNPARARAMFCTGAVALLATMGGCRYLIGLTDRTEANPTLPDANTPSLPDADTTETCVGPDCIPTSCANGDGGPGTDRTCGADRNADCCESIPLAQDGGIVQLANGVTRPVGPFRLDKFEVTVARMRVFIESGPLVNKTPPAEGSGAHPRIPFTGWDKGWNGQLQSSRELSGVYGGCAQDFGTWTAEDRRVPLTCATWYEALAFCIWDGGRLPTEAEWVYAASGGDASLTYPFSQALDGGSDPTAFATFCGTWTTKSDAGPPDTRNLQCTQQTSPVPVGALGATGPLGHADLAGNAFEHVFDWSTENPRACTTECAEVTVSGDPRGRVIRGGSFRSGEYSLRNSVSDYISPGIRKGWIGFRCARDL